MGKTEFLQIRVHVTAETVTLFYLLYHPSITAYTKHFKYHFISDAFFHYNEATEFCSSCQYGAVGQNRQYVLINACYLVLYEHKHPDFTLLYVLTFYEANGHKNKCLSYYHFRDHF